jgi:hypothetical protein
VCDYLQDLNPVIEGFDTRNIIPINMNEYVTLMRNPETWGGAIEINCTSNIWNLRIIIKNIRDEGSQDIEFIPIKGIDAKTKSVVLSWNGNHYEPIMILPPEKICIEKKHIVKKRKRKTKK